MRAHIWGFFAIEKWEMARDGRQLYDRGVDPTLHGDQNGAQREVLGGISRLASPRLHPGFAVLTMAKNPAHLSWFVYGFDVCPGMMHALKFVRV